VTAEIEAPRAQLFEAMADLSAYPEWMSVVTRAEPARAEPSDAGPAWWVTLRGTLGPLRRSKRLRMVRTRLDAPTEVRFERAEIDGREHSSWTLDAALEQASPGSDVCGVRVSLVYGGSLWSGVLERALDAEIDEAIPRLGELVRAGT